MYFGLVGQARREGQRGHCRLRRLRGDVDRADRDHQAMDAGELVPTRASSSSAFATRRQRRPLVARGRQDLSPRATGAPVSFAKDVVALHQAALREAVTRPVQNGAPKLDYENYDIAKKYASLMVTRFGAGAQRGRDAAGQRPRRSTAEDYAVGTGGRRAAFRPGTTGDPDAHASRSRPRLDAVRARCAVFGRQKERLRGAVVTSTTISSFAASRFDLRNKPPSIDEYDALDAARDAACSRRFRRYLQGDDWRLRDAALPRRSSLPGRTCIMPRRCSTRTANIDIQDTRLPTYIHRASRATGGGAAVPCDGPREQRLSARRAPPPQGRSSGDRRPPIGRGGAT